MRKRAEILEGGLDIGLGGAGVRERTQGCGNRGLVDEGAAIDNVTRYRG